MTGTSRFVRVLAVVVALASLTAVPAGASPRARPASVSTSPPNILLLVSDDQAWSTFNRTLMPRVYGDLADHGVLFDRAYVESSLCCPSRSEMYTGLDEQHTGVDTNVTPLVNPTIAAAAHDKGYRTMLAGKYLNSHPCTEPPSEFDVWYCQATIVMKDPIVYPGGVGTRAPGYTVDVLADQVGDFITSTPEDQPFFAVYAPKSPHVPMDDDRYESLDVPLYRPPNYDAETRDGTFPYAEYRPPLADDEKAAIDAEYRAMSRATRGLDTAIGSILDTLGSRADNTLIVYLSDNGVEYGEHRRAAKPDQYEEDVRVPFVVKYPALRPTDEPATSSSLVANIDIAPTVAELLGVPWVGDGVSFLPLLSDPSASTRDAVLISQCEGRQLSCAHGLSYVLVQQPAPLLVSHFHAPPYVGVVTPQWKLVDFATGEREVYDLRDDPYELDNRGGDPAIADIEAGLETTLQALLAPKPVDTMIVSGPPAVSPDRVVRFQYSSRDYQATFRCRLDVNDRPGKWKACPSMDDALGPLADGDYVFDVAGTDSHGNADKTPASRAFTISSTGPPATMTAAPPAVTRSRTLHFSFESSAPQTQCRLSPPDSPGDWSPCDPAVGFTASVDDGAWEFEVRGVDGASMTSPPAAALVTVDTAAPTYTIDPKPGGSVATTTVSGVVTPLEPISGLLRCTVDGGAAFNCTAGTFTVDNLAEGLHALTVDGTDVAGNHAVRKSSFTVDLTAPVLTVSGAPPPLTGTEPVFDFTSNEPGVFLCSLNGGPTFTCAAHDFMPGFADREGTYTLAVQASDAAGNLSPAQQFTWATDRTAPTVSIDGAPVGLNPSAFVTLTLESEPDAGFECSLDGVPGSPCTSPVELGPLADGTHTLSATAMDVAGNRSAPATVMFVVDASGAATTVASPAAATGESGRPGISADGRYVVFATTGGDLGDGVVEVDRSTDTTSVLATNASLSDAPVVADAGDVITYVGADGSGAPQVWVHDASGTALVSQDSLGAPGLAGGGQPTMSGDGEVVAFTSADALVDDDVNGLPDVYVLDRMTGVLTVASGGSAAAAGPALSADGRWLAFVEGDRVRLTDLVNSTTSDLTDGTSVAASPTISADGRWVDWIEGGAVVDLDRTTDTRTTLAVAGSDPSISGDGRMVAFETAVGGVAQVLGYDRLQHAVRPFSVDNDGVFGDGPSQAAAVDGDGHAVAFVSSAPSLTGGHTAQVLVHDWLPPVPPGAPLDVMAVPGDAAATVNWNPPAASGGIVRYDVVASPGGQTISVAPTVTTAVFAGLADGVATTFSVTAVGSAGAATSSPSNAVTPLAAVSLGDASVTEPDAGAARVTLRVTLSRPSATPVEVHWQTLQGTAGSGDFVVASGTVTVPAGAVAQKFDVRVRGDLAKETDEKFTVAITADGATVADGSATVTIVDEDPDPTVAARDLSVVEGSGGSKTLRVRVTLSAPTYLTVSVKMATVSGTATKGVDFGRQQRVLTFPPGVVAQTFLVSIVGDALVEGDETFSVVPAQPVNAIAGPPATVTILDDD